MAASLSKTLKLHRSFVYFPRGRSPAPTPPFSAFSTSQGALSAPPPPPPTAATAAVSLDRGKERGKFSKLLLFLPGAITFGLGTWQIIRRQEKIETIDYRRKRLELEPILWNSISYPDGDLASLEFRKVICEGVFDESKTIYLGPRSRSISGVTENGYYVITPLIPTTSEPNRVQLPILVNRGWVPRDWRDKHLKSSQGSEESSDPTTTDAGEKGSSWWRFWAKKPQAVQTQKPAVTPIKIIGVIRGSEKPSVFVPANNPSSGQWFYVDVPIMARASVLPENTVYIEDINDSVSASNPYPIPKDVETLVRHSVMPQDHLNYTLTWYSLSAAVTFMAVKRIRPRKSRR